METINSKSTKEEILDAYNNSIEIINQLELQKLDLIDVNSQKDDALIECEQKRLDLYEQSLNPLKDIEQKINSLSDITRKRNYQRALNTLKTLK